MPSDDDGSGRKSGMKGPGPLIFGMFVGLGIVAQALWAFHRDGWGAMVQQGARSHFHRYPWWMQASFGLVFMGLCLWALVAAARKP